MASEYDDFLNYMNGHAPLYSGSPSHEAQINQYAIVMSRRSTSQGSNGSIERMDQVPSPGPSHHQGPNLYSPNLSSLTENQPPLDGPPGFPLGVYTLVTDDDGDSYWELYPEYAHMASRDYPPSIIHSRKESNATRLVCLMESCESKGRFQRKADLIRHYDTVHASRLPQYDCPMKRCGRKGANGFSRLDHRMEHMRYYHHADVSNKRQRAY